VNGSLANGTDGVLTRQVQSRQDSVSALGTKRVGKSTFGVVGCCGIGHWDIVVFDLGLSTDAGDFEEQLSNEGDGGLLIKSVTTIRLVDDTLTRIRQPGSNMPRSSSGRSRSMALVA
jgi:hypothetical protein